MIRPAEFTRFRWLVLAVFVLSTAINYLDRQTLTTLAPLLRTEFQLSNAQYGLILTAFSITYALSAPFAGMLIDRIGLNRAISLAVGLWSCAGIATGFTSGLSGLVGCRAVLGVAEAGGIPAAGKAIHQYLRPAERALGNAVNQAGVSLGMILAPPIATFLALRSGWRQAFVVTGILGLLWIPLWNWAARRAGGVAAPRLEATAGVAMENLHDHPGSIEDLRPGCALEIARPAGRDVMIDNHEFGLRQRFQIGRDLPVDGLAQQVDRDLVRLLHRRRDG